MRRNAHLLMTVFLFGFYCFVELIACFFVFSYTYEDERGIFPETQFVFDLELPESFQPVNIDGEVQAFYLLTIDEVFFHCLLIVAFFVG